MGMLLTAACTCSGAIASLLFLSVVHRLSRKKPLIIANILLACILAVLAALTGATSLGRSGSIGGVAMIFLFFVTFSSSYGPLSWVYATEIFPTKIRSVSANPQCLTSITDLRYS